VQYAYHFSQSILFPIDEHRIDDGSSA
jgi:hypothetical protein